MCPGQACRRTRQSGQCVRGSPAGCLFYKPTASCMFLPNAHKLIETVSQAHAIQFCAFSVVKHSLNIYILSLYGHSGAPWRHTRTDFPVHRLMIQCERTCLHLKQAITNRWDLSFRCGVLMLHEGIHFTSY